MGWMELKGLFAGPTLTTYRTKVCRTSDNNEQWEDGYDLQIGYQWPPDAPAPISIINLAGQDCSQNASLTTGQGDTLIVGIDVTGEGDLFCAVVPDFYITCTATISPDGKSLQGTISRVCQTTISDPLCWRGDVAAGAGNLGAILSYARLQDPAR